MRKVNNSGDMSWKHGRVFVSEVFRGEEIGLEQTDEDLYRVFYCNLEVGEFDSVDLRFSAGSENELTLREAARIEWPIPGPRFRERNSSRKPP